MLKREIIKNYREREQRKLHLFDMTDEERLPETEPFEDVVMDRALAEQILAQAKLLPKELYRTFVLYYGYELSVSEVAAALGVGKEAVKSRLFRAGKQLKTACDGMNDRDRRIGGNENE
jgi:RNA polymerase sigma factor (sigma-70 family)